ncbi:MAG: polysaccharide pyruvyl transferase family protein [Alphaproteobacteria bacterium]
MLRVGLLWHSLASGNLGVRALTLAQLAILEAAAAAAEREVEAVIFGHPDWGAPPIHHEGGYVRLGERYALTAATLFRGPRATRAAFRRCDLLLDIGEGDSFADIYGARRYLKQVASKALALASGRPLVLAPQTVGPFGPGRRAPAAAILGRSERVFARDGESADFVRRIAPRARLETASDIAFLLPWDRPPRAGGGRIRIGVNVSGLLYGGGFRLPVPYADLTDALLSYWTARGDCEVHLLAHVLAPPTDPDRDADVCRDLAARFPGARTAPAFVDPRAAKSWLAGLDFFVGARMHACIGALSAGVPLVPLAYTRKATGLFRGLGYEAVVDLRAGGLDDAVRAVLAGFERRAELAGAATAAAGRAVGRLSGYRDLIGRLVAGT